MFDKYFTLVVPEDDLSSVELYNLLDATSNSEKFATLCSTFDERGLLETAMDRLDSVSNKIPVDNFSELVPAAFNLLMPDEPPRFFAFEGLATSVYRILRFGLLRVKQAERFEILKTSISQAQNLYLPVELVGSETSARKRQSSDFQYLLDEVQLKELEILCLQKINEFAKADKLASNPRVRNILARWLDWRPEDAKQWLLDNLDSPEMCVKALRFVASTSTGETSITHYSIKLSSVAAIVPVDLLEKKLKKFDRKINDQTGRQLVEAFWLAIKRRKEGKPDLDGRDLWRDEDTN